MKKSFTIKELETIIEKHSFEVSAVDAYATAWHALQKEVLLRVIRGGKEWHDVPQKKGDNLTESIRKFEVIQSIWDKCISYSASDLSFEEAMESISEIVKKPGGGE